MSKKWGGGGVRNGKEGKRWWWWWGNATATVTWLHAPSAPDVRLALAMVTEGKGKWGLHNCQLNHPDNVTSLSIFIVGELLTLSFTS